MSLNSPEIDQSLERVDAGSASAAEELVRAHRGRLRKMVAVRLDRRLAARIDPSDVVQDVLLQATRRLPEYIASCKLPFYPWLRQIAWDRPVELHHNHVRVQKRSIDREQLNGFELSDASVGVLVQQLAANSPSPSAVAIRSELRKRVQNAFARSNQPRSVVDALRGTDEVA